MYFYHDHCKKDYDFDYHKKDHDCKKYYYYYYYYYYPCYKKYDYDYDYKKFDHFDHCKKKKHYEYWEVNAILYGWMTSTLFLLPRDRDPLGAFLCHVRQDIMIQQLCRLLQGRLMRPFKRVGCVNSRADQPVDDIMARSDGC